MCLRSWKYSYQHKHKVDRPFPISAKSSKALRTVNSINKQTVGTIIALHYNSGTLCYDLIKCVNSLFPRSRLRVTPARACTE